MLENLFSKVGLSLDRLKVLVEVAEAGGISKAVGHDPVRQSQYSRQLKELEAFFGRKLTGRNGRALVLTPEGRRLATMAREQFQALAAFAAEADQIPLTVRIGAGESLINWLIIPRLHAVQASTPQTTWRFSNLQGGEIMDQLLDQRLDFGVVRIVEATPPLKATHLGRLPNALFIPAVLAKNPPTSFSSAIRDMPMAVLEGRSRIRSLLEDAGPKSGRGSEIRFECASLPEIASLVRCGLAAGVLPQLARAEFAGAGVIEVELPRGPERATELQLVWNPRNLAMNSKLERVRGLLARCLGQKEAGGAAPGPAT